MWVATYFPTDRWLSSPRLTAAERKLWENINWCDEATELVHNCDTYRKSPGAQLSRGYWCYLLQARTLYPEDRCFDPNFFYLNFTRIAPLWGNFLWQMGPGRLGPAKMSKFSRAQCTGTQSARAWFSRGSICQKKKSPLGSVCLDPFSKWRGFKLRYWFLSWCLPYSFGILFLNLSLSFPIFSLPPFLTNHKMFPLTLHLSMRHPICLFYPRKTFSQLVSFTGKLILVVDWFYFKYTVFRSTLHGSVDNADQG